MFRVLHHNGSATNGLSNGSTKPRLTNPGRKIPAAVAAIGSLRHNFVIKSLGRLPGLLQPHKYVYLCLRCKWSFVVNDGRRGVITAVDRDLKPLSAAEADERLASFTGPCPSLDIFHRMPPTAERPALRLAVADKVSRIETRREFRFPV